MDLFFLILSSWERLLFGNGIYLLKISRGYPIASGICAIDYSLPLTNVQRVFASLWEIFEIFKSCQKPWKTSHRVANALWTLARCYGTETAQHPLSVNPSINKSTLLIVTISVLCKNVNSLIKIRYQYSRTNFSKKFIKWTLFYFL